MAAAFVLGEVCAAGYMKGGSSVGVLLVLFFAVSVLCLKKRLFLELLLVLFCFLGGFFRFSQEQEQRAGVENAAKEQAGQQVKLLGRIDWVKETPYGMVLTLSQVQICGAKTGKLKLCAYIESSQRKLSPGDSILAEGVLEDFERPRNPGEFDSFAYYRSLGFHYSVTIEKVDALREARLPVYRFLMAVRERLMKVYAGICTRDARGIYQAMILGEKSDLSEETKELYRAGGISHILAISGLHISMLGMGLYRSFRHLGGFGFSGSLAGALMCLYVMMTGSAVSACRAVLMFLLQLFSFLCRRSYDMLSAAAAALLLLLWQNPMYIESSACQLSFGAVFAIGLLHPLLVRYTGAKKLIYKAFLSSISVSFVTFPIVAWHFYEISPYSILLNLIVIPCMTLVMLSGLLGGIAGILNPWAGRFFIALGQSLLTMYEWLCKGVELLPGSRIVTGRPGAFSIAVYYALLLTGMWVLSQLCAGRRKKELSRYVCAAVPPAALLCLTAVLCTRIQRNFFVCFLDVSQGDGIYMETPEHIRLLVDGGSMDEKKLYENSLLPFLKYRGVTEIDYAVVTHADEDHISGLRELLADSRIQVKYLLLPEISEKLQDEAYKELLALAGESGAVTGFLSAGDCFMAGKLEIVCLHPYEGLAAKERNAYSTVLSVSYGAFDMLLTGDLDSEGEKFLLEQQLLQNRQYEVLKVAHHGSRYSTGEAFLERVSPACAVISCGKKNRYGHPHEEVLQRLARAGVKIFTTAGQGAVMWESNGKEIRKIDIR